jgi:aryl-alcohol dehydrogenase-like predicted oxidoreductase
VANYSVDDMLQMQSELAKYDIPLATNQCEYSILRRHPEMEGMLEACRKNEIVFQSYSSLAQGRLSGKYTKDNPPPKTYRFSSYSMEAIEPTLDVIRHIGSKRGLPVSAVSLNWNIVKGAIPVVGFRKASQTEENLKAFGWRLTNEEIQRIDAKGIEGKETILWQQG